MGQAVIYTGGHEAELVADVIAGAFESFREDALRLIQGCQCYNKALTQIW